MKLIIFPSTHRMLQKRLAAERAAAATGEPSLSPDTLSAAQLVQVYDQLLSEVTVVDNLPATEATDAASRFFQRFQSLKAAHQAPA